MIAKSEWDQAVLDHLELVPGTRLPDIGTPEGLRFWEEWRQRFESLRIKIELIKQAMRDVRANPPREHARHMPAVLDRAVHLRTASETSRMLQEYRQRPAEPAFSPSVLKLWGSLPKERRERFREQARRENPGLAAFDSFIEPVARGLFAANPGVPVRQDDPASATYEEDPTWPDQGF